MFKVIIAGGRDFNDYDLLKKKVSKILSNKSEIEIVSGTANGADKLGERYANEFNLNLKQFPANWDKFGKRAGYLRNKDMAIYANACICFWNGQSKGTEHMINLAKSQGIPLRIIKY